jgi:hypothetical protein
MGEHGEDNAERDGDRDDFENGRTGDKQEGIEFDEHCPKPG